MSTYSGNGLHIASLLAPADAETWQYHFTTLSTTEGDFALSTGASGPAPVGVLQDNPKNNLPGSIRTHGTTLVYADGSGTAINVRDFLTSGSDGQAVITTASGAMGYALQPVASGASILIEMVLTPVTVLADNTP